MRLLLAVALTSRLLIAQTSLSLSPVVSPRAAQAAVTSVSLIASGFPSGDIAPTGIAVNFQPAAPGGGPSGTTGATSVRPLSADSARIFFTVPPSIATNIPASYLVTVSGSTSIGATFVSGNAAALTLNPPAQIVSLSPKSAVAGQSVTVLITGVYSNFLQGATVATFGSGVTVTSLSIGSPTLASAQLSIAANAPPGPATVTLATGLQQAVLSAGFTILPGQPASISASPAAGPPSSNVTLSGTGFYAGETVSLSFDGNLFAQVTADATGSFAGATLTIPASATPGAHTIAATGQASGLSAQTSFTVRQDWVEFRFTPNHTGYNPTENVLNVSNVGNLQLRWKVQTVDYLDAGAAVVGGVVFLSTDGLHPLNSHGSTAPMPTFFAFNPANGQIIFQTSVPFNLDATMAIANGIAYDSEYNGGLDAFDISTGQLLWSASTGGASGYSSPVVADGVVYCGALDHDVHAFDATNGNPIWTAPTGDQVWTSPAVASGIVYAGSYDNNVYAFNAVTGQQIWSFPTQGQIFSSPSVDNGVVYIGSDDGNLYALDAATGAKIWSVTTGGPVKSSPAYAGGVVYVGSFDHNLYAFDASTGSQLWKAPTSGEIFSSPAVANGVVYVASFDHSIYAFNASTGAQLWSFATNETILASPVISDGALYLGSRDKAFYAFSLP